ncbi:hypothetical protein [Citromicrobium bathyomarinum]|uniref:hypothetical protein n=1 Tax=Citromicrobium bathyomarinum TaxID=72174 RepID=UPI001E4FE80D|nr:hypothetical protein [Citromicrobium bathyomarinum]MCD1623473.1 hypothetical protein [Citromicrobium bathyomarinum]
MKEPKTGGSGQKFATTVYWESEEQRQRVENAARGNVSQYVRERVLFDEGYADPRHDVAARLMRLADELSGELHAAGDLVRALTALRQDRHALPAHAHNPAIERVEREVEALISRLLESHQHRVDLSQELIAAIASYSEACADWEVRQNRAATRQKRGRASG